MSKGNLPFPILSGTADKFNWDAGIHAYGVSPFTVHGILKEAGIVDDLVPMPWDYVVGPMPWGDTVIVWVRRDLYDVAIDILEAHGIEAE